jgi:hypothetical protein
MTPKAFAPCAAIAVLFAARAALAQTQSPVQADSPSWLSDRRYSEGPGIRTGDVELHLGAAGEAGYDSNWLLRTDRQICPRPVINGVVNGPCDNGPPIIPAAEFRITPSFSVATLGPQRSDVAPDLAFRAGVSATLRQFIALSSDSTSNSDLAQENGVGPSILADARMDILAGRPVGGAVFANYARVIQPNETSTNPNLAFDRDDIGIGAELAIQPGSGTLDAHFGYQLHTELFEESQALGFSNLTNQIYVHGRWKFRPRTAIIYNGSVGFNTYTEPSQAQAQGLVGSTPIRSTIGINGLVTERFSALAIVGWGASFLDNSPLPNMKNYDSVIGQAEIKWYLAASPGIAALNAVSLSLSSIALGYTRDFQDSYLGNYYGSDRGYLRFAYFFAGRALVSLEGGFGAVEYPDMYWIGPTGDVPPGQAALRHTAFTDWRADATLFGEYRFSDVVGVNATLRYTTNISNELVPDAPPTNGVPVPGVFGMGWNRFEAFLGVRYFM